MEINSMETNHMEINTMETSNLKANNMEANNMETSVVQGSRKDTLEHWICPTVERWTCFMQTLIGILLGRDSDSRPIATGAPMNQMPFPSGMPPTRRRK